MKISIVVPAYNEEGNIAEVIEDIERSLVLEHELIIVNDHSTDSTVFLARELCRKYHSLKIIDNPLTQGFANTLKTGFSNTQADIVIPIMGDLCDDLSTVKIMADKINEGYDIVCGSRYIKGGARIGGSKLKGFFSFFVGWSLYYLLGLPTHDIANAFKMYRKKVIDSVDIQAKGFEISMEIPLKAHYLGFKITEVPTVWRERIKGKSNFRMFKLFPKYFKLYIWGIFKRFAR